VHARPYDMRLHDVGVITGNVEGSMHFYTSWGYAASAIYADPIQKARIVLMQRTMFRSDATRDGEPGHAAEDDPMKVLPVLGKDVPEGGGAISISRLHDGLRKAGIDSRILCGRPTQPTSVAIPRALRTERMLGRVTLRLGLKEYDTAYEVQRYIEQLLWTCSQRGTA
jgi:hypothetical protein